MVIQILISLVVLVIVFCSALLGMLVSRILPQHLLTDQTKGVVTGSMGVVGTLTALVLGLLIAGASSSYYTKNQEVVLIAADVIRLDRLLRRYGPEAEGLRDLLRRYTAMKIQDLFPEGTTKLPNLENPKTVALLEELQERLVDFDASNLTSAGCSRRRYNSSARSRGRDGFWPSRTRLGSRFRCWCWWRSG
jgi:hypothetical protein